MYAGRIRGSQIQSVLLPLKQCCCGRNPSSFKGPVCFTGNIKLCILPSDTVWRAFACYFMLTKDFVHNCQLIMRRIFSEEKNTMFE